MSAIGRARMSFAALALVIFAFAAMSPGEARAAGMTLLVNSTADPGDGTCDASCTLRDAIIAANANPGIDTIHFAPAIFPLDQSTGLIFPVTPLPKIEAADGITIDGVGAYVYIGGHAIAAVGVDGLLFRTNPGDTLQNVTVRNLTLEAFTGSGISVRGGESGADCLYDVAHLTVSDIGSNVHGLHGVSVRGVNGNDISIARLQIDNLPNGRGAFVQFTNKVAGIAVDDSTIQNVLAGITVNGNHGDKGVEIRGNQIPGSAGNGITVVSSGSVADVSVTGNSVSGVTLGDSGIAVISSDESISNVRMASNSVDSIVGSGLVAYSYKEATGVVVEDNAVDQTLFAAIVVSASGGSGDTIRRNTVQHGKDGIALVTTASPGPDVHVTISRNSTSANGQLGIDLYSPLDTGPGVTPNDAGDGDSGPNDLLNFPVITGSTAQDVSGTVCASCLVELFLSDNDPSGYGEGQQFLRDGTANGAGAFSISICGLNLLAGQKVTATATDSQGNTSEFSLNFALSAPSGSCPATPSPSPTPSSTASPTPTIAPVQHKQGDLNCDGKIDGLDALIALLAKFGLAVPAGADCTPIGQGSPKFGDVNCSGAVDEGDALAILAFKAQVTLPPKPPSCTATGELLS